MIRDFDILENTDILYMKKFVIWGVGQGGKSLFKKLIAYTENIVFVDSDKTKSGSYCAIPVDAPDKIEEYDKKKTAIIISTDCVKIQESILEDIKTKGYWDIDIYTKCAIEIALYFEERKRKEQRREVPEKNNCNALIDKVMEQELIIQNLNSWCRTLRQIFFSGLADNSVYIYQCKKVGSVSLSRSVNIAGAYAVHIHSFAAFELEDIFIRNMIKKTSGKVISVVREPIARQMSLLWHYLGENTEVFLKNYSSMHDLERKFFSIPNREDEFDWFGIDREFAKILNINVFEYPFDCEKGYSVIEKDGISLLLLKLEKMNSLEKVIGDFLGLDNFRLINENQAKEKRYRYTYENYIQNVKVPSEFLEYYYGENKYMDHFYSKEEKDIFYKRWKNNMEIKNNVNV